MNHVSCPDSSPLQWSQMQKGGKPILRKMRLSAFPARAVAVQFLILVCFSLFSMAAASIEWPECNKTFHINPPVLYTKYLAFGLDSLWVSDPDQGAIWRLSPVTGAVQGSIPNGYSGGIAFDGQYLWKAAYSSPVIRYIRTTDGSTVREIPGVGTQQAGLAWDGTHLWIADRSTQRIYQLDPNTGTQLASFDSPGPEPRGLTWWNGYLYHCDSHEDRIYQIDPSTGTVISSIATPMRSGSPRGLTTDGNNLWYSGWYEGIDRLAIDVSPNCRTIHSNPILMLAEMTYSMTNTGTSTIENPEAYWSVPEANDEHVILELTFTPTPDSYVVDVFGQQIAHFSLFSPLAPGSTTQIVCHAYEMIWRADYQIDPEEVLPLSSIPEEVRDLYLVDGDFLHISHPEILAAAASAIGTETNPYLMAIKIHDYVAQHMTYGSYDTPYDALEILRTPFGGCAHYAILYMALGRAVGLPTRKVKSFYYYENEDYALNHVWPEAYIPGYGWIPIDPTRDDRSPLRHRYIGCEPLGIVYFRNGGTDTSYVGQWGRSWWTGGLPRTSYASSWGTAPLCAAAFDASRGSTFGVVDILWTNPPAMDLSRVVVRRTTGRYPASREDGVVVYESNFPTPGVPVSVSDSGLSPDVEYFYALFAESMTGLWNTRTVVGVNADKSHSGTTETTSVFRVDSSGNVFADQAFYGTGFNSGAADVAEWVPVSESVEPGDVLELDPDNPGHYRKSRGPCSDLVAGVVSTNPGFVLGSSPSTLDHGPWTDDSALLALVGIVPVKVTDEGGSIEPGDLLVASSTRGYAMRWSGLESCPCALVGKALEPMPEGQDVILILLTAH